MADQELPEEDYDTDYDERLTQFDLSASKFSGRHGGSRYSRAVRQSWVAERPVTTAENSQQRGTRRGRPPVHISRPRHYGKPQQRNREPLHPLQESGFVSGRVVRSRAHQASLRKLLPPVKEDEVHHFPSQQHEHNPGLGAPHSQEYYDVTYPQQNDVNRNHGYHDAAQQPQEYVPPYQLAQSREYYDVAQARELNPPSHAAPTFEPFPPVSTTKPIPWQLSRTFGPAVRALPPIAEKDECAASVPDVMSSPFMDPFPPLPVPWSTHPNQPQAPSWMRPHPPFPPAEVPSPSLSGFTAVGGIHLPDLSEFMKAPFSNHVHRHGREQQLANMSRQPDGLFNIDEPPI